MTDTLTPEARSALMSKIQGGWRRNRLERAVHLALCAERIPHRMNPLVRPSADVEVRTRLGPIYLHIDGCFWHGCPEHHRAPKNPRPSWNHDLVGEQASRDAKRAAAPYPWVRIWEHEFHFNPRFDPHGVDWARGVVLEAVRTATTGLLYMDLPATGRIPLTWDEVLPGWASW